MKGTIRVTVKVAGFQKERRFVKGTPARVRTAWKTAMRAKLQKRHPQPEHQGQSGTLAKDAERYYGLIRHLADWVTRRSEIRAWLPHLGTTPRHMITREDVLRVRGIWVMDGRKPKTINNRVTALRNLFHLLDGDDGPTPCDSIKQLTPEKLPPAIVAESVINRVLDELQRRAEAGHKHAAADRARLMVLASTGKRPCEIERAQPADVDLRRRVWIARDAKGGFCPGVYLNTEMVLAWEAFTLADAWGPFPDHFPRRLRDAGWPARLRPYNLRHSTWIEASERGNDLSDIQAGAGHKLIATTRRHYVPVLSSRMQRLSESLDGRFGWQVKLAGE
jgi:integrase